MKSCSNCKHRRCRPSNEPLIERMLVWKCDITKRKIANTSKELEKLKGCEKWTK